MVSESNKLIKVGWNSFCHSWQHWFWFLLFFPEQKVKYFIFHYFGQNRKKSCWASMKWLRISDEDPADARRETVRQARECEFLYSVDKSVPYFKEQIHKTWYSLQYVILLELIIYEYITTRLLHSQAEDSFEQLLTPALLCHKEPAQGTAAFCAFVSFVLYVIRIGDFHGRKESIWGAPHRSFLFIEALDQWEQSLHYPRPMRVDQADITTTTWILFS